MGPTLHARVAGWTVPVGPGAVLLQARAVHHIFVLLYMLSYIHTVLLKPVPTLCIEHLTAACGHIRLSCDVHLSRGKEEGQTSLPKHAPMQGACS